MASMTSALSIMLLPLPSYLSIRESPPVTAEAGVPVTVADQAPGPAALTARTCTSYCVPPVSPVKVYCREPEPAAHTSSTTVQLASDLSAAPVSM